MIAHEQRRVRATIGRGSDFFGPHAHQSTVGDLVFGRALAGKPARVLGDPDSPHTVTYIEDFAPRLRTAPGWGLALAGLFNPTIRAVREQLYQAERPWVVDSGRFERTFGWTATPLSESIEATTTWFRERSSAA
jgi:hypothetical protein